MTKIPVILAGGAERLREQSGQRIVRASSLEVHFESGDGAVIALELEIPGSPDSLIVPLSPPAAMRLAKELRRSVCRYLNGPEKE